MSAFSTVGDVFTDPEFAAPGNSLLWGVGGLDETCRECTGFIIMPRHLHTWRVKSHGCYEFDCADVGFEPRDMTAHFPAPGSIMRSDQARQRRIEFAAPGSAHLLGELVATTRHTKTAPAFSSCPGAGSRGEFRNTVATCSTTQTSDCRRTFLSFHCCVTNFFWFQQCHTQHPNVSVLFSARGWISHCILAPSELHSSLG